MSEEKNEQDPSVPPTPPKKPSILPPKKSPVNPFNKNNNRFVSPKFGNSSAKGSGFKGGGVKKGK